MSRYLLDTNVISNLMRDPRGLLYGRIRAVGEAMIYTSIVVAAELRFGAAKKGSERLMTEVEAILGRITVSPLASPADRIYGDIRQQLQAAGATIGANDLWIASQTLQDGSILVTDNMGEFSRVPSLKLENWLREGAA